MDLRRESLPRRRWVTRWKGRSSTARVRVAWRASGVALVRGLVGVMRVQMFTFLRLFGQDGVAV